MSPHFRIKKLRHFSRYPTQVEADTVFHRRHIQFFGHDVYMHYLGAIVKSLFVFNFPALVTRAKTPEKSGLCVKLGAALEVNSQDFLTFPFFNAAAGNRSA